MRSHTRTSSLLTITLLLLWVAGCSPTVDDPSKARTAPLAFTGERSHDFGKVDLVNALTRVDHEFALKNTSNKTMRVARVASTCGCTVADASPQEIGPGEFLRVRTQLKLSQAGVKQEKVAVVFDEEHIEEFLVRAIGVRVAEFFSDQFAVALNTKDSASFALFVIHADGVPGIPELRLPAGVSSRIEPWVEIRIPSQDTRIKRFQCRVHLTRSSDRLADDSDVQVKLDAWEPLTLSLVGKGWRRDMS